MPRTVDGIGSPGLLTVKQTSCATVVPPRTRVAATWTRSHHLRLSVTRAPLRVVATAQTRPRPLSKRVPPRARALTCQCWTSPVHRPFHRLRARAAVAGWRTATLMATRSPRVQAIGPVTRTSLPSCVVGRVPVDRVGGDVGAGRVRSAERQRDYAGGEQTRLDRAHPSVRGRMLRLNRNRLSGS